MRADHSLPVPADRPAGLQAVLFDMDGLLVDTEHGWGVVELQVMEWLGSSAWRSLTTTPRLLSCANKSAMGLNCPAFSSTSIAFTLAVAMSTDSRACVIFSSTTRR